ncbi:MAG: heme-binding domain-containing protein, partial [Ginsengibacter sp.]
MKKIVKIIRPILVVLLIALIIIQFFRPQKNAGEEIAANQIAAVQNIPENVQQILKVSCYDCHSNTTKYPWYSNFQPVAWFLNDHIVEGKKEVNFSEFGTYRIYRRYKKLKEIQKQIKEDEMPLYSYTLIHRDAVMDTVQKLAVIDWTANAMKEMEAKYPA